MIYRLIILQQASSQVMGNNNSSAHTKLQNMDTGDQKIEDGYMLTELSTAFKLLIFRNEYGDILIQLSPMSLNWKIVYTFLQGNILYIGVSLPSILGVHDIREFRFMRDNFHRYMTCIYPWVHMKDYNYNVINRHVVFKKFQRGITSEEHETYCDKNFNTEFENDIFTFFSKMVPDE